MSPDAPGGNSVVFAERVPPRARAWVYLCVVAALAYGVALGMTGGSWIGAVGGPGAVLIIGGTVLVDVLLRRWRVTRNEIVIENPAARFFHSRHIPLVNIRDVEPQEGKAWRRFRETASKIDVTNNASRGYAISWCRGAIIVRLARPDRYGGVVFLSTPRPHEAADAVTRAVREARLEAHR